MVKFVVVTNDCLGFVLIEQEIMQRRMVKLRESVVVKQIAVGREFKGQPFTARPAVIHFKVSSIFELFTVCCIWKNNFTFIVYFFAYIIPSLGCLLASASTRQPRKFMFSTLFCAAAFASCYL